MNAFVSWSGGKDCMSAMYFFLKEDGNRVVSLLNMCEADGLKSRSHGLNGDLIAAQAEAMNIPILQQPIENNDYEQSFKKAIVLLKERDGIEAGVFGDIYLDVHRDWIERVCRETGIKAVFPIWKKDTVELLHNFIDNGFKTIAVAVRKELLPKSYLGRILDNDFLSDISSIPCTDPCGENGEFHTFVFDGPLFSHAVQFEKSGEFENEKYWYSLLRVN